MRKPTPAVTLCLAVVLTAVAARAAQRLRPPSEELARGDNRIAVVVAVERSAAEWMLFRRVRELVRETPEEVTLRAVPEVLDAIAVGQGYIVGFSYLRKNPRLRDVTELDPEGPRIVTVPVVGAAILEDTPDLRTLFRDAARATGDEPPEEAPEEAPDERRARLERLLRLMLRPAPGTRRVAITELYLRPDLHALVDRAELAPIQEALGRDDLEPVLRDFLLQTGLRLSPELRGEWLTRAGREVLADADTRLDLASMVPALLQTAARVLRDSGGRDDVALVARHLGSNSPGVVKVALETLDALDPAAARREAEQALERGELHEVARQALEAYLRRGREPAADA